MAYSDYGAFVYRNGERQRSHEDAPPYREDRLADQGWTRLWTLRAEGLDCYHAVLGQDRVRLCGYKNSPSLFIDGEEVADILPYLVEGEVEEWRDSDGTLHHSCEEGTYAGEVDGYRWRARQFNGNMVDLEMTEPDGTRWKARCGYLYGNGHMEDADA